MASAIGGSSSKVKNVALKAGPSAGPGQRRQEQAGFSATCQALMAVEPKYAVQFRNLQIKRGPATMAK